MFGWRRRSEGFEWKEYVRTTVLVRRADRQRKLDEARLAAIERVQQARDKGIDAGLAGVEALSESSRSLFRQVLELIGQAFVVSGRWLWAAVVTTIDILKMIVIAIADKVQLGDVIDRLPKISIPKRKFSEESDLGLIGQHILNYGSKAALFVGVVLIGGWALQGGSDVSPSTSSSSSSPTISSYLPSLVSSTEAVSGQARALTGDKMEIAGRTVQLDGVIAPYNEQPCYRSDGRRWNCARAARRHLAQLTGYETIACELGASDANGVAKGSCRMDGVTDIAAEMVRQGIVFSAGGVLSGYGAEESEARDDRRGVWAGEKTEHPQEWRNRLWENAKQSAPNGCPVRAVEQRGRRVYLMPWSKFYNSRLGRRNEQQWFCDESEARAAGFIPYDQS